MPLQDEGLLQIRFGFLNPNLPLGVVDYKLLYQFKLSFNDEAFSILSVEFFFFTFEFYLNHVTQVFEPYGRSVQTQNPTHYMKPAAPRVGLLSSVIKSHIS